MAQKIQFAGIDGSGKSTCLELLISNLERQYKILKVVSSSAPEVYYRGEKSSAFKYYTPELVECVRRMSKKYRVYGVFLIFNLVCKQLATKYFQRFKTCDLIIHETDTLLHPAAYITFHFPLLRAISHKTRFRLVSRLLNSKSRMTIIFLDVHPNVAMERICNRGTAVDPHETRENLQALRTELHTMLGLAVQDAFDIVRIDTDNKSPADVLKEILLALNEKHQIGADEECLGRTGSVVRV